MHPPGVRNAALALLAIGLNDGEVARRTGLPRTTVRDWRKPASAPKRLTEVCPRCWQAASPMWFSATDYAELLGLYLGDGHIVGTARTFRLRLFLDTKYQGIVGDARALLDRCFAGNRAHEQRSREGTTTILSVYSSHLPCLFPQHGHGKKHERRIELERWQRIFVETAPLNFLRGCIRSDGSFFINRTGVYRYPSYEFTNYSTDIAALFAEACDLAGIRYRRNVGRHGSAKFRINRRESVGVLLRAIGIKE
jgi:hypothetical protein